LRNECENYRAWFKATFKEDLPKMKKRKTKSAYPTREEIQKREEQIAGKSEAYSIIAQAITVKQPKRRGRPPGSKRKAQS